MDYIKNPMEIENTSMKIIEDEMGEHNFTKEELSIIKRTIHTTADFEYKDLVEISKGAIEASKEIFKKPFIIYTDTNMALSGINKIALSKLNGKAICYVNLEEVHKDLAFILTPHLFSYKLQVETCHSLNSKLLTLNYTSLPFNNVVHKSIYYCCCNCASTFSSLNSNIRNIKFF